MLMIASPMPMRTSPWWLLLLAVIAYGGSVFGDFLLDDFSIFSDPVLTSASGWWEVWRPAQTRPLTYFTFWANYMVAGRQAAAYHVVNLTLHLGAVWLAFAVLRRLMPAQTAWFAAGIFAVHPMQSEAVNYIFARSTLLMAVFCLLSLNDWLGGRHWRAVLWFALALLAKEEAVGFAVFVALLHLSISRNQKERRPIAAMLGLSVVFGLRVLFATAITKGSGAGVQAGIGTGDYLARQGAVITGYLLGLAIPLYSIDPPSPPTSLWFLWGAVLLLASIASRRFSGARAGFWVLAEWRFFCRAHPFFRQQTWWLSAACISRSLRLPSRSQCIFLSRHGYWRYSPVFQSIAVTSGRTRSVSGVKLFIATHTAYGRIFNWREPSNPMKLYVCWSGQRQSIRIRLWYSPSWAGPT